MTNEERALVLQHIIDTVGTPKKLADPQDLSRFTGMGIEAYTLYLTDYGLGAYKAQNVITTEPHLLDDFLEVIGLVDGTYPAGNIAALFYGPFGDCVLRTSSGDTILINAVLGTATVMKSDSDLSPIELELEFATELSLAIEATSEEQLIGIDGKNLRVAASKRLGPLEYGQCYGFFPTINAGGIFDADNLEIVPLVDHLLFLHEMKPFDVMAIDNPADLIENLEDDESFD